ncbi:hypothetical protein P691DRAFT_688470 [Macrolepiota fuliginosa MF-IS2]|uniref:Uncharacterized protein n=1 Tax=Macrolepiota fuliginosa MF-IS2 TaxID=1400762 RepID=A0A9P5WYC9_9AGAR|nr:hypothetical protein P691DRAFT_688470 [Macrolepiota fuliginosa MF-IS2]
MTDLEVAALEALTRGAAKAVALARTIFNNKDDKKGQGNQHVFYFETRCGSQYCHFPDTSNTHFGSHALAACEILVNLDLYIEFLCLIWDTKQMPSWTNIEVNISNTLHDNPTLTELAVFILYSQSVTHPYMQHIHGPGTNNINVLELQGYHDKVKTYLKTIINQPQMLLDPIDDELGYHKGAMDSCAWEWPEAINVV